MITCEHMTDILGVRCAPVPGSEAIIAITTPYAYEGGGLLSFYAERTRDTLRLFDDGWVLYQLSMTGLPLDDRRRWKGIRDRLDAHGLVMPDDGTIEISGRFDRAPELYATFTAALLSILAWQREAGKDAHALLLDEEVQQLLRAWRPNKALSEKPARRGLSGTEHQFDFLFGDQLVDAISAHSAATGSVLRKISDIQMAHPLTGVESVLVIVDDRLSRERAEREARILSGHANALLFSDLERNASVSTAAH